MDPEQPNRSPPLTRSSGRDRNTESNLTDIKRAIKENGLTMVFGTGISISAVQCSTADIDTQTRSDAKSAISWKGLIRNGLQYLGDIYERSLEESERRELACYKECLEQREIATEFKSLYHDVIGEGENAMLDSIKRLHDSDVRIMTTNYDDLISRRCKLQTIVPKDEQRLRQFFSGEDGRSSILHIHGQFSQGEDAVLVFVGTGQGLADPNFGSLLRWASENLRQTGKRHNVLVSDQDAMPNSFLEAVRYGDYDRLPSFLSELAPSVQNGA
ncbi:hypothetical protein BJX66DRAFT_328418 [Aspergillus keveii]|uniref:SIR2-like domain-containing protein n=1 Tax=Aspergillus keveii TaxID=714993 RepID=A0ABR4FTW1_9EURO